MKKLCLIGAVDKRIIAYPLIKCLLFLGRTLIVSDDGAYRRFSEEYEREYSLVNSTFLIETEIDSSVVERVKRAEENYEYIVYITTNELPDDVDKIVYCRGVDKGFVTSGVLKTIENKEYTEVVISFSRDSDSSVLKIEPSKSILTYIYDCEDKKEFLPCSDGVYANLLEKFFIKELGVPKKTIAGLLKRKV